MKRRPILMMIGLFGWGACSLSAEESSKVEVSKNEQAPIPAPATAEIQSSPEMPGYITDPVEAAAEFVKRKDHIMAITLLDNLLQRRDLSKDVKARALFLRAMISLEMGKSSEAIVRLSAWLEQFPDRPEASNAYLTLGQCFREMQATYRAREAFYRTLTSAVAKAAKSDKVDLSTPQLLRKAATWEIAETEYQSANWERADELFQRFREQNPESTELSNTALYRQADCTYQLGDMMKATEKYETALAVSPFHPFAPEAQLRLLTLYGLADNPKKQSQALESFIWLVKNLHQDQTSYWQQRCAALLLDNLKSDPQKQSVFLNELMTFESSDELKGIFDYYKILISRTENTIQNSISSNGKKQRDEGWNDWKESFNKMQAKIETDLKTSTQMKADNAAPKTPAP
ncbi:MAG: tetratricopeptide repeat protein [Verrucomicrobiota bacterium]